MLLDWPLEMKIPVVDLNRIFLLHYRSEDLFTGQIDGGFGYTTKLLKLLTSDADEPLKMVTLRALCNFFNHTASIRTLFKMMDTVLAQLAKSELEKSTNLRPKKPLRV